MSDVIKYVKVNDTTIYSGSIVVRASMNGQYERRSPDKNEPILLGSMSGYLSTRFDDPTYYG